ncbi:unnamed protein product [Hymenolepis diminuta]|uniref:Uncharacterized protein n=1 Tax=Hymenolepis diminuta TaxID=6216 RepID=A0A564ZAD2_HYMDI|nr:unnamed protein product [Hymenolepis diminuta]
MYEFVSIFNPDMPKDINQYVDKWIEKYEPPHYNNQQFFTREEYSCDEPNCPHIGLPVQNAI